MNFLYYFLGIIFLLISLKANGADKSGIESLEVNFEPIPLSHLPLDKIIKHQFTVKNNPKFISPKDKKIYKLLPDSFKLQLKNNQLSVYENLRIVIDFISGLTDSNASRLYKIISGDIKN